MMSRPDRSIYVTGSDIKQ